MNLIVASVFVVLAATARSATPPALQLSPPPFSSEEALRRYAQGRLLETPTCPLNPKPKILSAKGAPHWVRPQLIAQVRYTEITDDGRLRHPAYLGLREDKNASEVTVPRVPEVPEASFCCGTQF